MCGIAGIIRFDNPQIDRNVLAEMSKTLQFRGPDNEGFFFDEHVGLAHRRLAIIDFKSGNQPMTSEDGRFTIVFNGEIYNFFTIKESLKKQGVIFKTDSDTEVLLQLYIREKSACLSKLNGMFAFAIWDKQQKKLFAARDRVGKKPFYFGKTGNHFLFASELKALLKFPGVSRQINAKAVAAFFTYESVPEPLSIISGFEKLPAGHFLELQEGDLRIKPYWQPSFTPELSIDENQACRELLQKIDEATQLRLISDVPLGVFLSGGIDSSSIVALMARHRAGKDILTFSIQFQEASYDESLYCETVAQKFGTTHHVETLSAERMLKILPDVVKYMDEPFADGSILPTYLLSQFTRKHVTVALSGDGADEIFCGYPTFWATRYAVIFDKLPRFLQITAEKLAALLPRSENNMSLDFKLKQFLMAKNYSPVLKNQIWLSGITPHEQKNLFSETFTKSLDSFDTLSLIEQQLLNCDAKTQQNQLLYFYQKFYLGSDLLVKSDRASMANSLEVRAPYLDVNVIEFANHLPFSLKLKGVTTKYLLKKIFNRTLPAMITQRPKKGFGIPMTRWLKTDLRNILQQTLNRDRIVRDGIFRWSTVEKYIAEHQAGRENHRKPLFCLLMFHLWMDEHL